MLWKVRECQGNSGDSARLWHRVGEGVPQRLWALILMQNRLNIFLVELKVHLRPSLPPMILGGQRCTQLLRMTDGTGLYALLALNANMPNAE